MRYDCGEKVLAFHHIKNQNIHIVNHSFQDHHPDYNLWTFLNSNKFIILLLIVLILCFLTFVLKIIPGRLFENLGFGKENATITGMIIDREESKPVVSAKVRVKNDLMNPYYTKVDGTFKISNVEIPENRTVRLIIQFEGEAIQEVPDINLENADKVQYNEEDNTYNLGVIAVEPIPVAETPPMVSGESPRTYNEIPDFEIGYINTVTGDNLMMRAAKSRNSEIILRIPNKDQIRIVEETYHFERIEEKRDQWLRILYKGQYGYVFGGYVDYTPSRADQYH